MCHKILKLLCKNLELCEDIVCFAIGLAIILYFHPLYSNAMPTYKLNGIIIVVAVAIEIVSFLITEYICNKQK